MIGYKFVYVILHFNTIQDTVECVKSIKDKLGSENQEIVIVDNGSPNGSGKEIERLFGNEKGIHIILNDKNLGFARGNNVGFRYAKYDLKADYIVLLNSDTKILDSNMQQMVIEEYEESHCGVIGPKIKTPNPSVNVNPGPAKMPLMKEELREMAVLAFYWTLSFFDLDEKFHNRFGKKTKKRMKSISETQDGPRQYNVQLHGSFMVFTPSYIEKFDGLCDKTFLYCEEEILYVRCMKAGLKTAYIPSFVIFHKEDSSTDSLKFGKPAKKRRFVYRHCLKGKMVLIGQLFKTP